MEKEFPLSLPDGVSVDRLPWGEQDTAGWGGDRGWIDEASAGGGRAAATWTFGMVRVVTYNSRPPPSYRRLLCFEDRYNLDRYTPRFSAY